MIKKLSVCFLFLILFSCVATKQVIVEEGFSITFYNDTKDTACYTLYWFDHGLDFSGPAPMCGGELGPGKSNEVSNRYKAGAWGIIWFDCWHQTWTVERPLIITSDVHQLITSPIGDILK